MLSSAGRCVGLLIPMSMDTFLGGATELMIELDGSTAAIPWELLDTDPLDTEDRRPWAIRAKLLRRLRMKDFREQVNDAGRDASVLVIGEPDCRPHDLYRPAGRPGGGDRGSPLLHGWAEICRRSRRAAGQLQP